MRDLYEEIQEYYLLNEALSKEPSSPIEDTETGHSTKLTTYKKKHIGKIDDDRDLHSVSWVANKPKTGRVEDRRDEMSSLHDALHLHHHFIKNGTRVGDIVRNNPAQDSKSSGNDDYGNKVYGNKRAGLYKKVGGFGDVNHQGEQYGIVQQHPDDHPEESKRGQKYLQPTHQDDIKDQLDKVQNHIKSKEDQELRTLELKARINQSNIKRKNRGVYTKSDLVSKNRSDLLSSAQNRVNKKRSDIGDELLQ
jgi:hypothetical protein